MKFSVLFVSLISGISVFAQGSSKSSSEILQDMKGLNTLGSVMYIAAHPDDENTRLLAYLANERHMRTCYLSITRGDGGQNLIGSEQGEMLGLIRTEELLAARRTDGAFQWFTRANDFGYSKNPEETFNFWNHDSVLADVVFAIRQFKPDVIICRFPTTGEGGHGHHTASAILALEAFDKAADPSFDPLSVHTAGIGVWQAKRIFWNTFNFGSTNTTSDEQLKIDVGGFNPMLGKSYGEIASASRTMHKSQGFGTAPHRGSQIEYFKLLKGSPVKNDLFDDIDQSWNRIHASSSIKKAIDEVLKKYDASNPEKSVNALMNVYDKLNDQNLSGFYADWWKQNKLADIRDLILDCAGIWIETTADDQSYVPGQTAQLKTNMLIRSKGSAELKEIDFLFNGKVITENKKAEFNKMLEFKSALKIPEGADCAGPYWLRNPHSPGMYELTDLKYRGRPQNPDALQLVYNILLNGKEFRIFSSVKYKSTDPVKGEVYRPVEILPALTVTPIEKVAIINGNEKQKLHFLIKANTDSINGELLIKANKMCDARIPVNKFFLKKKGDEITLETEVSVLGPNADTYISAIVKSDNKFYSKGIERITYDHIPQRYALKDASVHILKMDLKGSVKKVAYLPGAGDNVAECLKQIGMDVDILSTEQIKNGDLNKYEAVVLGIRAYNTNSDHFACHGYFMDYMKQGGRMIVQYNTNSRLGPIQDQIGPYPFKISRKRVTDETAEVKFINDSLPVLNVPNRIDKHDFENWIQERGIYFAEDADSNYVKVFKMHDKDEEDLDGSLIYAKYGKGYFVYTGLAFFRELPAGVPGAYKLFVNILNLPVKKD